MLYLIDGYNFLFSIFDHPGSLAEQRVRLISILQKAFSIKKMRGLLIFDGRVKSKEESGRLYNPFLEVIYTPEAVSADAYIIEQIEALKKSHSIAVVTNDQALTSNARRLGAKTFKNSSLFQRLFIKKKESDEPMKEFQDSKQQIERLRKIFEG